MLPIIPNSLLVPEAHAFEGTTNYKDLFTVMPVNGNAASINGSTAKLADVSQESYVQNMDGWYWKSYSVFAGKRPASLLSSWTIVMDASMPTGMRGDSNLSSTLGWVCIGLGKGSDPHTMDGIALGPGVAWSTGMSNTQPYFDAGIMKNGIQVTTLEHVDISYWWDCQATLSYDYAKNSLSYTDRYHSITVEDVRGKLGNSAYIFLMGAVEYVKASNPGIYYRPRFSSYTALTFRSMSLPHLQPTIESVHIVNPETGKPYGKDDYVETGTVVRVECVLKNANEDAGSEQFPMHVKMVLDDPAHPTQGVTPVVDAAHPIQVDGATKATAIGKDTVFGENGTALTLVGTTPVTVSYYVAVDQSSGRAVELSQQLIEDSFGGAQYDTLELLAEKPLTPGPSDGNGDGDLRPGWDYHYTRVPAPNENGWNTSPVTGTFFAGEYDRLTVTPDNGDAPSTLTGAAGNNSWTYAADTDGYGITARADDSESGSVSVQVRDLIKIDSWAPTLTFDEESGALTASDAAPAAEGKATSGIWKIERTSRSRAATAGGWTYDLEDGKGQPSQTETVVPNGYYRAVDAAGNVSPVVRVGSTQPPKVDRPEPPKPDDPDNPVDPDNPDDPDGPGTPEGPSGNIPDPTVDEDDEGLLHATVDEYVVRLVDHDNPSYGGSIDANDAQRISEAFYAFPADASIQVELLSAAGDEALDALPTDEPGACLIRTVAKDDQGNTTTVNLHYRLVNDTCPTLTPTDPGTPRTPVEPDGPAKKKDDGTQEVDVSVDVTEGTCSAVMGRDGAPALLKRHFALDAFEGGTVDLQVLSMERADGTPLVAIDLSRPADYVIRYRAQDKAGNTTNIALAYHLVKADTPAAWVEPGQPGTTDGSPGTPENPCEPSDPDKPGTYPHDPSEDPTERKPLYPTEPVLVHPDGTAHATVDDTLVEYVSPGVLWDASDLRTLMETRYSFPDDAAFLDFTAEDAGGQPVDTVDKGAPATYTLKLGVADADGNTTHVRLRYTLVERRPDDATGAPTITPNPTNPDGTGGTGDPSGPGGEGDTGEPLQPIEVIRDPQTGLVRVTVQDTVRHPVADDSLSLAQLAELIGSRYTAKAAGGGSLEASPVTITDADGNPAHAIDRSAPGTWYAQQTFTDGKGNATTLRLRYVVYADDDPSGGNGDESNGGNPGDSSGGDQGGKGDGGSDSGGDSDDAKGSMVKLERDKPATFANQLVRAGDRLAVPASVVGLLALAGAIALASSRRRKRS